MLKANRLVKKFLHPKPFTVLSGISLTLERGQSMAIMGRSGEGKSTLLHILGTLEQADEGELSIAGQLVTETNLTRLRNREIGFLFQAFYLLEDRTIWDNITLPALIARQSLEQYRKRAEKLLERIGLNQRKDQLVKELSGGEKQRVALARALCNDPGLLLADEPSGNLDRETAISIHHLLVSLAKEENRALLVVTHDETLANLCDSCFSLNNGILEKRSTV